MIFQYRNNSSRNIDAATTDSFSVLTHSMRARSFLRNGGRQLKQTETKRNFLERFYRIRDSVRAQEPCSEVSQKRGPFVQNRKREPL